MLLHLDLRGFRKLLSHPHACVARAFLTGSSSQPYLLLFFQLEPHQPDSYPLVMPSLQILGTLDVCSPSTWNKLPVLLYGCLLLMHPFKVIPKKIFPSQLLLPSPTFLHSIILKFLVNMHTWKHTWGHECVSSCMCR